MEAFAGVMGLFVVGLLAYAAAQLRIGLRDLRYALVLARGARRAPALSGPVVLHGRARPGARLLSPPAGGPQVVAWSARGIYGYGNDAEHAPFVIEHPRAGAVHVEPERVVLLAAEATDTFSNRVRQVAPGTEVVVYGMLEERDGRTCLRDLPGHGVVVAASRTAVAANLARALGALVAVGLFGVVVVIAHLP